MVYIRSSRRNTFVRPRSFRYTKSSRSSSGYSRRLSSYKTRAQVSGTDLAKFNCKINTDVVLDTRKKLNNKGEWESIPGAVYTQLNVFKAIVDSGYFDTIRKLYDEVRLNSCTVKLILDESIGSVTVSAPSFLFKAAWDRNGITCPYPISVDKGIPTWDESAQKLVPVASQYASSVSRSGNFYSSFSSTHSWNVSSIAEKSQYIATKHLDDIGLSGYPTDLSQFVGCYSPNGMYASAAAKPTLLLEIDHPSIIKTKLKAEVSVDLTCRGVKVLEGKQFSENVVNVTDTDVKQGINFVNADGNVEQGTMVTVESGNVGTIGQLGGPIQIGIPGVKYDGACTLDTDFDPSGDDPGTYVSVSKTHFFSTSVFTDGYKDLYTGSFHKVGSTNQIRTVRIMAVLYIPKVHQDGINDAFICLVIVPSANVGTLVTATALTGVQPNLYDVYVSNCNIAEWPVSAKFICFYSDSLSTIEIRTTPYLFNSIQINTDGTSMSYIKAYSFFNPSIIDYTASLTDEPPSEV